jgi:pyruvate formate lyase activating enzyme
MSKALVFSIEEFSVFDGPGIRTSVFLMGCPLRCEWCHNPEGQAFVNSIVRSPNGCMRCGNCLKHSAKSEDRITFTEASIKSCPNGLLRYCAEEYSAEDLCARLEKNIAILNASGGGVTFSGGEPTASLDFLLECLSLLKGKTHRAVQTCGFCPPSAFEKVLANCDCMLFDVKLIDNGAHVRYTGVSNENILKNFRTLSKSKKDFVIRTPLIPTVTDTEKNIRAIAWLLADNGVKYIELLPYNKMAGSKYRLAGRPYAPSFDESAPVSPRIEIFAEYGIEARKI